MIRTIVGVIIGILNILLYAFVTGTFIYILIDYRKTNFDYNYHLWEYKFGWYIVVIICCLIMTLVSILLIVGILKQYHILICPWLFFSMAGILLNIIGLFVYEEDTNILFNILGISFQILIWYLIYTVYKDIKLKTQTHFVANHQSVLKTNYDPLSQNNI